MESLNDKKFNQLTLEEMKSIEGGWGWRVINVGYIKPEGAEGSSVISYQYYNILGNATNRYKENYD